MIDHLTVTCGELTAWLAKQPSIAPVVMNVGGFVGGCDGHTLGFDPDDHEKRIVVLTAVLTETDAGLAYRLLP